MKTASGERVIPLVGSAKWAADRILGQSHKTELAFPSYNDGDRTNANSASAALNKWLKGKIGHDYTIHSFRHSMRDRLRTVDCPSEVIDQHAITEHKRDKPSLSSESNPFAKLRSKAEEKHENGIRINKSPNFSARAWTPQEMEEFKNPLRSMSPELRLVSIISLHNGARLKDSTGLMLSDVNISNEENSFIHYRHNKNRKISKDSIERVVHIFETLLNELKEYKAYRTKLDQESVFPKYCGSRGSGSASNLLNQRHLDIINKDKAFKMYGLHKTYWRSLT